jgi:hypothetical protein
MSQRGPVVRKADSYLAFLATFEFRVFEKPAID